MGDLTKNLSRSELACKCGCGFDTGDIETVKVVQQVCDHFNCKVIITSWCRCGFHNAKVKGSDHSQHLYGRAADCQFQGVATKAVYDYLNLEYPDRYGLGLYDDFNHIDTRTNGPARW